ncbi:hypothetical protein KIW84_033653 [Lathyrus oleraceus]|uniref:Uncharacterized protein n=1 Tax=Pisum sativum TaxID=3888 RepID=A0A9D5AYA3_PEA|nr:hypothetical protein KIW84_033653 [Pisum sativum]
MDSANEAENSSGNLGPSGVDGINNPYFLAQRMELERQRSLPNPYPCWPGIDTTSFLPKSVPDASPYSKLMPLLSDNSRQFHSPNFLVDLSYPRIIRHGHCIKHNQSPVKIKPNHTTVMPNSIITRIKSDHDADDAHLELHYVESAFMETILPRRKLY